MPTILDVAKAAGVSVATVSRALNGKRQVSPETLRRVRAAAESLHYTPNVSARNLRLNKNRIILIVAPNLTNPYYAHIIAGIGKAARHLGYSAFLCNTQGSREQEEETLGMLLRRQADGAILMATERDCDFLEGYARRFALVQCSEYAPGIDIPRVSIDNFAAAREAMDYLIGLGHRKIAMIGSENNYISTVHRLEGYRRALAGAGIGFRADYVLSASADYTFKSGFDCATALFCLAERPTALLCVSDMLALGAIASAREMGLKVPEDVTVVGFDDVEHTTMFHPHVTTVAQPCAQLGEKAMEMLALQLDREECPQEVLLAHRLVLRQSSAPPR